MELWRRRAARQLRGSVRLAALLPPNLVGKK
jgi:hypothetical protein